MRIHSDTLTGQNLFDALPKRVYFTEAVLHGSRKRARAFEIKLSGSSSRRQMKGEANAATWDEWGAFLGALFNIDPNMTCSYYADADAFHARTGYRFEDGTVPADTHKQHKWTFVAPREFQCSKCSAAKTYAV